MQLTNPTALLLGLLAVPIVVFYILKIRLRRVPVSTVMFWDQVFDQKQPRSIWQSLRHPLSLLLQLLFLAILVMALCDPFLSRDMHEARRIVLVVDNSASMNATDVSPHRFHAATQRGFRFIRGLRLRDQMAIVSAGSTPRVELGLTSHQRTLRESLAAVLPTDGPTRVVEAVAVARRLLTGHPRGEVIVLTDGCFPEAKQLDEADDVHLVGLGSPADNVGITQFQVRRSLLDVVGYQILIEVMNLSSAPVPCRLEVDLEGELVDVVPLDLAPGERWTKVLDHVTPAGGRLVARIDVDDALACDNQAVALLPRRAKQPVLLVTDGSLFLQSALEAVPLVELSVTNQAPATIPNEGIVVYHRQNSELAPHGNALFIEPVGSNKLWDLGEPLDNPIVTMQNNDSSLMAHVQLENVVMPGAKQLELLVEHQVLASSLGGQPLYAAIEHPRGKTLVLTVDLHDGDLPLRMAFPIMITNAMAWFQGKRGELHESVATGSVVDVDWNRPDQRAFGLELPHPESSVLPPTTLVLRQPNGQHRPLPSGVDRLTMGPLDQCGVWRVEPSWSQANSEDALPPAYLELACNLANPGESDLRATWAPERIETHTLSAGGRPIWFYLVAVALTLTALEWYLYQRRWIS